MKKLLTVLMCLAPLVVIGQYTQISTHYDSEYAADHIMKGHLKMFLNDTVKVTIEKKNERYVTDCGLSADRAKVKVDKVFAKGRLEYTSRTNGGYMFTISVVDVKDNTKVLNYVTFHMDPFTQKLEEIEILLGD